MEVLLLKVEWSTLIFFACLFVIMGTLEALGLLALLGGFVQDSIRALDPSYR
ncbi:Hypothetical protein FKW44_016632 [Caligus rogercresseyi]|uniref:Citrate transporter-like domain-containing protein n=1 Tax=Caligus rogercresseyi TaxID=217165 RepID=A0A7T8H2F1_CALRO|nr:Hypothetical protein FKW44_016632 [Caligus rogercresseyi]